MSSYPSWGPPGTDLGGPGDRQILYISRAKPVDKLVFANCRLAGKLRRFMGRENQRLRREVLAETSTPDSSPGQMNGEEYMNWVNDPISRRIRAERAMARKRRNDLSGTTDRETSSATPSDSSLTPLTPPLPGWPR